MDPIDDVFAAMRVHTALHARIEARAPWGVTFVPGKAARFGLVVRGSCWLQVEGEGGPIQLAAGDCYIIVRGTQYSLSDAPGSPTRPCYKALRHHESHVVRLGGDGEPATVITGWFLYDSVSVRPLVDLMPTLIQTRMDEQRSHILQATLQLLAMETAKRELGATIMVSRLADILFIQTIRNHAEKAGDEASGWLGALGDARLAPVFSAIHARVEHPWTVEALAAIACMSRSAFAQRFKARVGFAPLDYVTRWRMFRAGNLLLQGRESIAAIGYKVGYESEAAFGKAFRRVIGMSPGGYRKTAGEPQQLQLQRPDPRADGREVTGRAPALAD